MKIVKLIFGYILPGILSLGIIVINFIKFTGICAAYLVVTLVTLILSAIFLAVNFMRVSEVNIITSLWYTAVLQTLVYSIQASTGVNTCLNKDTGQLSITWEGILWDTFISKASHLLNLL